MLEMCYNMSDQSHIIRLLPDVVVRIFLFHFLLPFCSEIVWTLFFSQSLYISSIFFFLLLYCLQVLLKKIFHLKFYFFKHECNGVLFIFLNFVFIGLLCEGANFICSSFFVLWVYRFFPRPNLVIIKLFLSMHLQYF